MTYEEICEKLKKVVDAKEQAKMIYNQMVGQETLLRQMKKEEEKNLIEDKTKNPIKDSKKKK